MGTRRISRRALLRGGAAAGLATATGATAETLASLGRRAGATAEGPNVVVIMIDSVRPDHVGAYAGSAARSRTPSIDAFAAQSLRFTHARHESYPTVPVRRSLMTGKRVFPFRGWRPVKGLPPQPGWEGIGRRERLFTDLLAARGYRTGYVTDNPHILRRSFDGFRPRFDEMGSVRGQIPFRSAPRRRVSAAELRRYLPPEREPRDVDAGRIRQYVAANRPGRPEDRHLAARVFQRGIDFLARANLAGTPFALVLDSFDVHEPWDPPDSYVRRFTDLDVARYKPIQPFATPGVRIDLLSKRTFDLAKALYAAELQFVDAWVGRFLDELDTLGLADDTLVFVLSDHGVQLGERGVIGKSSYRVHGELIEMPFMIRDPAGRAAGETTAYHASAHDIAATALAAAGVEVPRAMEGVDLGPLLAGRRPRQARDVWTSGWNVRLMAGDERWLLIADNQLRDVRLYDTRSDPRELRDVAGSHPQQVRRLKRQILLEAGGRPLPRH